MVQSQGPAGYMTVLEQNLLAPENGYSFYNENHFLKDEINEALFIFFIVNVEKKGADNDAVFD